MNIWPNKKNQIAQNDSPILHKVIASHVLQFTRKVKLDNWTTFY